MDTIMVFFPKSGQFFQFSKKGRVDLPPSPLIARLYDKPTSGVHTHFDKF